MIRNQQVETDDPRDAWRFRLADLYPVAGIISVATYIAMQCLME